MKYIRVTLLTFIISVLLCVSVSAAGADPGLQDASITYAGIKIVLDGATIVPKDLDGQPAEPFLYQGTTYLPVRALANALGLTVDWEDGIIRLTVNDAADSAPAVGNPVVSRGTRQVQLAFRDVQLELNGRPLDLKNADGSPAQTILYADTTYLPLRALSNALNIPVYWDEENNTVYLGKRVSFLLSSETHQDLETGKVTTVTYAYDEQGRLETEVFRDQSARQTVTVYYYDEEGQLAAKEVSGSGELISRIEYTYEYDQKGNCIKETATGQDGSETVTSRTFDSKGNCVSEIVRAPNGDEVSYGRTYDDFGNLLTLRCVSAKGTETHTYTYNEFGQVSTYLYETEITGTPLIHLYQEKTFDENGLALSSTVKDDRRAYQEEIIFTYDRYGNLITAATDSAKDTFIYLQADIA